ncbi:Daple-like protein [Toxocara canis]|uniref:Daple-like protein n=1 Tax=Toxocara canis TaxID=6265 RepID=A0A0B2VKA0_TOXCA|nr:Daple-like protein [Toxocara canis]
MQTDLQTAIVKQIQRVTEEGECVLNVEALELDRGDEQSACVLAHLERVIKERDTYANCLLEMAHEHESDEGSTATGSSSISGEIPSRTKLCEIRYDGRTPSPTSLERHANVELASAKAELRKLRNLAEEKEELVAELRDELEAREADVLKMQQERLELIKDARAAKDYRDELDCLQHKLSRMERLETENTKLREKLAEMEFFKSRITQLKEENDLMHESCSVLEEQLEQSQRKASAQLDLESKLAECQNQMKNIPFLNGFSDLLAQLKEENDLMHESCSVLEEQLEQSQRKASAQLDLESKLAECQNQMKKLQLNMTGEREKIEQFILENGRLERELKAEQQKSAALERRIESLSEERSAREDFGSLGSQMADDDKKRILELQLENRKLKSKLQTTGESEEVGEIRAKLLRAEIELSQKNEENAIASRQLQQLEITLAQLNAQYKEACEMYDVMKSERDSAQQSLHEARRNFSEFQADFQKEVKDDLDRKTREFEATAMTNGRLLENAREEKLELEQQLEKIRAEQKVLRGENERLIQDIQKAEQAAAHTEKLKRSMEMDRNALKDRNEILEQRIDEIKVKQMNMENVEKRLEANEQMLAEKQNRLNEVQGEQRQMAQQFCELENVEKRLEANEQMLAEKQNRLNEVQGEQRQMAQQLELEMKKTDRLREDLVAEKSRYGDLIARLRSVCATIQLNGGRCEVPSDDEVMVMAIDDVILKALTTARREADALRVQQQTQIAELTDLRNDIEKLRKSDGHISNEADDRLRELTVENRNVKEQVFLLQERIRELQLENSAKSAEISSLKREIEETQRGLTSNSKLHTELAKLQVSLRNLQLQEELLRQDNSEMQKQIEICEKQKQAIKVDLDAMQSVHSALLSDHDRLQTLHDMLTADYDRVKYDNSQLKLKLKNQKSTAEEVAMMRCENERERRHSEELKAIIAEEKERRELETRALQDDLTTLRVDYEHLRQERSSLKRKAEMQAEELKRLRITEQSHRSTIARLSANIDELSRALQARDLEVAKMQHKIDMLNHLNRTLEEESKTLVRQVDHLLAQNQDLLARALNDKDNYHAEQKEFQEKLAALRRHKEKLEEKIMEQYRMMDNKKNAKEKQTLVKRAAKALIPKSPKKNSTTKANDKIIPNESTAEESSTYSTDEPPHHGSSAAVEGQSTTARITSLPSSFSDQAIKMPSNKTSVLNFPRNGTVRITTTEKRASPCDYEVRQCSSSEEIFSNDCDTIYQLIKTQADNKEWNEQGEQRSTSAYRCSLRSEYSVRHKTPPIPVSDEDGISLCGSERAVDVPTPTRSLPPRPPTRTPVHGKPRAPRPPPPPYNPKGSKATANTPSKPPPPPYPGRPATPSNGVEFVPQDTSTPKSDRDSSSSSVVAEGERREVIRDKEERQQKVMSVYENVDCNEPSTANTVWYEYGCV